jgi:hypothetical protein
MLKVRDPLSERVHLSPLELLATAWRHRQRDLRAARSAARPVSKPAAGA